MEWFYFVKLCFYFSIFIVEISTDEQRRPTFSTYKLYKFVARHFFTFSWTACIRRFCSRLYRAVLKYKMCCASVEWWVLRNFLYATINKTYRAIFIHYKESYCSQYMLSFLLSYCRYSITSKTKDSLVYCNCRLWLYLLSKYVHLHVSIFYVFSRRIALIRNSICSNYIHKWACWLRNSTLRKILHISTQNKQFKLLVVCFALNSIAFLAEYSVIVSTKTL